MPGGSEDAGAEFQEGWSRAAPPNHRDAAGTGLSILLPPLPRAPEQQKKIPGCPHAWGLLRIHPAPAARFVFPPLPTKEQLPSSLLCWGCSSWGPPAARSPPRHVGHLQLIFISPSPGLSPGLLPERCQSVHLDARRDADESIRGINSDGWHLINSLGPPLGGVNKKKKKAATCGCGRGVIK